MESWRDKVSDSKRWDGPTQGRLVVIALCRYGDIFEQSRFFTLLEKRGNWVLYCDPAVAPLFSRLLPQGRVVSADKEIPQHEYWTSIAWVHEGLGALPLTTPPFHVSASPETIKKYAFLRERHPVVGVSWQAGEEEDSYPCRHLSSEDIEKILTAVPNARWVNLQHKRNHLKLENIPFETWEDTAGLIHNLDAVISCDTSVPHLSGTMGNKTIVLHARAQTSLTQYQPYETLYPGAVKMFTPDHGSPVFSKTSVEKFLEYMKQNPGFMK